MDHTVYYIWALLPLALFWITIRAAYRRAMKLPGREYPSEYLKQAVFCTGMLGVTIFIDKHFYDDFMDMLVGGYFSQQGIDIFRFVEYLLVLFLCAKIQKFYTQNLMPKEDKISRVSGSKMKYVGE